MLSKARKIDDSAEPLVHRVQVFPNASATEFNQLQANPPDHSAELGEYVAADPLPPYRLHHFNLQMNKKDLRKKNSSLAMKLGSCYNMTKVDKFQERWCTRRTLVAFASFLIAVRNDFRGGAFVAPQTVQRFNQNDNTTATDFPNGSPPLNYQLYPRIHVEHVNLELLNCLNKNYCLRRLFLFFIHFFPTQVHYITNLPASKDDFLAHFIFDRTNNGNVDGAAKNPINLHGTKKDAVDRSGVIVEGDDVPTLPVDEYAELNKNRNAMFKLMNKLLAAIARLCKLNGRVDHTVACNVNGCPGQVELSAHEEPVFMHNACIKKCNTCDASHLFVGIMWEKFAKLYGTLKTNMVYVQGWAKLGNRASTEQGWGHLTRLSKYCTVGSIVMRRADENFTSKKYCKRSNNKWADVQTVTRMVPKKVSDGRVGMQRVVAWSPRLIMFGTEKRTGDRDVMASANIRAKDEGNFPT